MNNPLSALEFVIESTDYIEYLRTRYPDDFPDRYASLEELKTLIRRYTSFDDFIADLVLHNSREEKNTVKVMTVHSSKGLEFDVVFLIGVEENIFPDGRNTYRQELLDEEVRIFYVAVTRARKLLFISASKYRNSFPGKNRSTGPSNFFKKIH